MHLCANLEIRNADLEMPWNRTGIVEREMELEKCQRMALLIRLDTLEKQNCERCIVMEPRGVILEDWL